MSKCYCGTQCGVFLLLNLGGQLPYTTNFYVYVPLDASPKIREEFEYEEINNMFFGSPVRSVKIMQF